MASSREVVAVADESVVQIDAVIAVVIISVLLILVGSYFVYLNWTPIGKQSKINTRNVFTRFSKFYDLSIANITLTLIIAFLVSDVVGSFNVNIMTPIVKSAYPKQNMFGGPLLLPRAVPIYPGEFLQAIIGFILSLFFLFLIAELLGTFLRLNPKKGKQVMYYIIYFIIGIIFISILVWNLVVAFNPTEEELPVNTQIFQMPRTPMQYSMGNSGVGGGMNTGMNTGINTGIDVGGYSIQYKD